MAEQAGLLRRSVGIEAVLGLASLRERRVAAAPWVSRLVTHGFVHRWEDGLFGLTASGASYLDKLEKAGLVAYAQRLIQQQNETVSSDS